MQSPQTAIYRSLGPYWYSACTVTAYGALNLLLDRYRRYLRGLPMVSLRVVAPRQYGVAPSSYPPRHRKLFYKNLGVLIRDGIRWTSLGRVIGIKGRHQAMSWWTGFPEYHPKNIHLIY